MLRLGAEFVPTKLPQNTQLILGSEIDVNYPFDRKTILDRPYQLLDEIAFQKAEAEIKLLLAMMYSIKS
ncbi:MAG: hypothetical protein BGO99_01565 [Nitrosospira sp. 56-18]|nr:MAG: hypothetical protein BGO99_01565 [Nitrosospira sp. 56-18]